MADINATIHIPITFFAFSHKENDEPVLVKRVGTVGGAVAVEGGVST